jgi:hypothetical protein
MIPNWNRLEEWLWRADELRRMLEYQEEISPFRSTLPPELAPDTLPSRNGNAKGES